MTKTPSDQVSRPCNGCGSFAPGTGFCGRGYSPKLRIAGPLADKTILPQTRGLGYEATCPPPKTPKGAPKP
jgi:hypothetical protein